MKSRVNPKQPARVMPDLDPGAWILVVDDDPILLKSVSRALSDQATVETARSGQEALDLLRKEPAPAVAVVDQQMPGMTGIELLRRLKADFPGMVRIMLTGHADLPTAMDAVNEGQVFRFLTKPVALPDLQQVVAEALQVHQQRMEENRLMAQALAGQAQDGLDAEAQALQQLVAARLTPRELDVLRLVGQGRVSKEIGPELGISHRTVDVHRSHIMEKLGLHNATSLVRVALKAGLV